MNNKVREEKYGIISKDLINLKEDKKRQKEKYIENK